MGVSIQRKILGARFDQVAVVLKTQPQDSNQKPKISIFESIDGSGVQKLDWDDFKQKN